MAHSKISSQDTNKLQNMAKLYKNPKVRQRALIVINFLKGIPARDIAEFLMIGKDKVYYWYHRYLQLGPEGLFSKERPGRPNKVDIKKLQTILDTSIPRDFELEGDHWSVNSIRAYIAEIEGITIHDNYIYQLLSKLNWKKYAKDETEHDKPKSSHFKYPRTESGEAITEVHLRMMKDVAKNLDAPIHKFLEGGIQPVLKIIYSDKYSTILEGNSENGIVTIKYEQFT